MRDVTIQAAADLGHVRVNFNYGNVFTTSAAYGDKARRSQYAEGPHEMRLRRLLEMSTAVLDFQFQPLVIRWVDAAGRPRSMFPDVGIELEDHSLLLGEMKANLAYLSDPAISAGIRAAHAVFREHGVPFVGISGQPLARPAFERTVKAAYDDRRTRLPDAAVSRAHAVIAAEGGAAPLGRVLPALAPDGATGLARLHAAMLRRLLTYDLSRPPTADTVAWVPAPRAPKALRAFLRRFTVDVAA